MDILFENSYVRSKEVIRELYRKITFKRPLIWVIYFVLGGIALLNIVKALCGMSFSLGGCVYVIIFFFMQLVMCSNSVSTAVARDRERFGPEALTVRTQVTEEGIQAFYGEKTADPIPVSQIKKAWVTKNLIVLHTTSRLVLIFDRNHFTVGTQEEFLNYLRENGLKV